MDKHTHFKICDCGNYYTIENTKAHDFDNYHTHITKKQGNNISEKKQKSTCKLLIKLICKKTVPNSAYLRESAKRLSRDKRYIRNIEIKEEKDRNKQKFYRVNKGIRL